MTLKEELLRIFFGKENLAHTSIRSLMYMIVKLIPIKRVDLLLESKRIEHVIFEFEQDLWEY